MDTKLLENLRHQAERVRAAEIAAAERKYQESLKAIDLVGGLHQAVVAGNHSPAPAAPVHQVHVALEPRTRWPGFRQAVWNAIEDSPNEFSTRRIIQYMESHFPNKRPKPARVSSELRQR